MRSIIEELPLEHRWVGSVTTCDKQIHDRLIRDQQRYYQRCTAGARPLVARARAPAWLRHWSVWTFQMHFATRSGLPQDDAASF